MKGFARQAGPSLSALWSWNFSARKGVFLAALPDGLADFDAIGSPRCLALKAVTAAMNDGSDYSHGDEARCNEQGKMGGRDNDGASQCRSHRPFGDLESTDPNNNLPARLRQRVLAKSCQGGGEEARIKQARERVGRLDSGNPLELPLSRPLNSSLLLAWRRGSAEG